ncbi:MAG: HAMP domain-containing sensor histidine kinase [Planctomycetota bacterium]
MSSARAQRDAIGILTSRIGRRFVALFAGCALLPLVVFAWLAVSRATEQIRAEQRAAMHGAAKTSGMGIAAKLAQVAADLALARQHARSRRDAGGVFPFADHVAERCEAVWVTVPGPTGPQVEALCGTASPSPVGLTAGERAWLASGKPLVRAVGVPPRLCMIEAVDPADPDGACVTAAMRSKWLWDVSELRWGGCQFAAFDKDWQPLFDTFAASPDPAPLFAAATVQSSSGDAVWQADGESHVARYWRVFLKPQYDFDLFAVQSRSAREAFAVSDDFVGWFQLTAAGTLLAVLLVSLVQMRRTLGPIVSLREATKQLAAGDLTARVAIHGRDEFGELGVAFNDMAAQLQEHIANRERTERELVASRDAALAAARAKAEFVTNVSHEFRTPMTEILSAVEILSGLDDQDRAAKDEFSGIALRGAQRLARLVDDVLELDSASGWEMAPVDVAATVREAIARLPEPVVERIRLDAAPEVPTVTANDARLIDIWCRLLDNAAKFSAPGTPIVVRVGVAGERVAVAVVDQGAGIARADQARIFEPFCQVGRDQLTDKANGTGLGLTLAKRAVERHGGAIEVVSEPGRGATFRVLLPVAAAVPTPG